MIPDKFEYVAPATMPEALAFLEQHPGEAKILAGGQSLIPLMKFRLASPAYLVDIQKVPNLDILEERDGSLVIGAMVRESLLETSPLIQRRYPALYDTSSVIADPLVRNFATVGGNLAHADPANDHAATMLAQRASVVAEGPNGHREIPIDDFLVDTFETALAPEEALVEIHIPQPVPHSGSAYRKLERKVGDYAIVGVAVQLTLDGDLCAQVGIGLTNVGSTALRAIHAENFLRGKRLDDETMREASRLAATSAQPSTDLRGPAEYKAAMVRTLTTRALRAATQRAMEGAA